MQTPEVANAANLGPPRIVRDDPEYDYYKNSTWCKFLILISVAIVVTTIMFVLPFSTNSVGLYFLLTPGPH
jgi:hypothetical protein